MKKLGDKRKYEFDKEEGKIYFTGQETKVKGIDGFTVAQILSAFITVYK